ncbi:MDR family MFS transporter [Kitasatospora sp. NPDC056446]|uniref:MDR family MFS transporter n=1 Tax=Kitasatospora sp. NPDC056446 TaxID=3345819 RepID=UPI0036AE2D54
MGNATDTRSAPAGDPNRMDPYVRRVAVTIIVGALAVVFDTTILSVTINDLGRDLHTSLNTIQWVSTGYLLALAVTMPIAAWAQSALGGKRLWIVSLCVFLAGSILCSLAWSAPSLIAFRVLQGIGGGFMMTLTSTLIMQAGGGRNIGRLMSLITVPTSLGPILGPVLGGVILHLGTWRWLFAINIPFCVVGAWLAWRNLPADEPSARKPLDVVGFLLLSPGVSAIVYGLSRLDGTTGLDSTRVLAPLLAGLVLVLAFVAWALRRRARALVDIRLLRHRPLASSSVVLVLAGAALYGTMLLLPLFFEQVRGTDALGAGLLLIPQGVGTLLSRSIAGKYTDRFGARPVAVVSLLVACLATVPFAFATADTSEILLTGVLLLRGMGLGAAMIPLGGAGFAGLGRDEIPHASILIRVTQQLGGSFGTAVLAVVLQHAAAGAHSGEATVGGFQEAFWWSVVLTAIAVPVCLLLPGRPEPAPTGSGTEASEHGRASERA